MNREIKFRGYAVEKMINSQWIEDAFGVEDIEYTNGKTSTYLLTPYGDYEVIPETVGQYTGLKDKNGKEIYEGDIISYLSRNRKTNEIFMVNWSNEDTCFTFGNIRSDFIQKYGEIVGNVYKNSELLEEY